ncbi:MAG: phage head-tail connector protein [Bacilli bacterium]
MQNIILDSLILRPGLADMDSELLLDIIEDSIEEVKEYINLSEEDTIPTKAIVIVKEIAIIRANKIGSEGLSNESYSGVSQSFIDGLPKDTLKKIKRLRKLPR